MWDEYMNPPAPPGMSHKGTTDVKFLKPADPESILFDYNFESLLHLMDDSLFHTDDEEATSGNQENDQILQSMFLPDDENEEALSGNQVNVQIPADEAAKRKQVENELLSSLNAFISDVKNNTDTSKDKMKKKAKAKKTKKHLRNCRKASNNSSLDSIDVLLESYKSSSSSSTNFYKSTKPHRFTPPRRFSRSPSPHKSFKRRKFSSSSIHSLSPSPHVSTVCRSPQERRWPSRSRSPLRCRSPTKYRSQRKHSLPLRCRSLSRHRFRSLSRHRSPPRCRSLSRQRSPPRCRSLSRHRSPPRCRSLSRHRSPPRCRSLSRHRSPPRCRSPSRHRSPPRCRSPSRHRSPPRCKSPSRHRSPPRCKLSSRHRSPPRCKSSSRHRSPPRLRSSSRHRSPPRLRSSSRHRSPPRLRSSSRHRSPPRLRSSSRHRSSPRCKSPSRHRSPPRGRSPLKRRSLPRHRSPVRRESLPRHRSPLPSPEIYILHSPSTERQAKYQSHRSRSPHSRSYSPYKSTHCYKPDGVIQPKFIKEEYKSEVSSEKKNILNSYYCEVCQLTLSSEVTWQTHIIGKKHAKVLRSRTVHEVTRGTLAIASTSSVSEDTPRFGFPAAGKKHVRLREEPKLQPTLDEYRKSPLVGLQFVKEIRSKFEISYHCELCDAPCSLHSIMPHLIGYKHQLRFLKEINERYYEENKSMSKRDFDRNLKCILFKYEKKYGRKTVKVFKECDDRSYGSYARASGFSWRSGLPIKTERRRKHSPVIPPNDECLDTSKADFYCKLCDAHMNNVEMWEAHVKGKRHLKNAKKIPGETISAKSVHAPNVPSELEQMIDDEANEDMIVGLEFIRETQGENGILYTCFLCGACCTNYDILDHLVLAKHRNKYLEKMDVDGKTNEVDTINHLEIKDEGFRRSLIVEQCLFMLKKYGRGRVEVYVTKP